MKKLNQIREDYDMITEKDETEERKLVALVRAGLFDAKKLPALKKALEKSADKMTGQEKRMLLNLLDELMSQVLSNQGAYQKVKQNLMKEEKRSEFPVDQTIPSVLLLKRKAIRTFPNGQKVALYYAQSIDKYVSIPYSDIGINEETDQPREEPKYFKPAQSKLKARVSIAKRGMNRSSVETRDSQLQRKALSLNELLKKPVQGAEDEGTEGHRDYNPWKGGGGGSEVMPRGGAKEVLKPGSTTGDMLPSRPPKVGGGQVRTTNKSLDKLTKSKQKRIRSQVQDMLKKYKDDKPAKKTENPYSKPAPKIETKPDKDLPKRQVDRKLETEKLPSAKSSDVTKIPTARAKVDTKIADKLKKADKRSRNPFAQSKTKSKTKSDKKKKDKPGIGAAIAAGGAAVLSGLGGDSGSTEPKYFVPGTPKLQATVTGPQRLGGGDSEKERMDQLQRKALKSQIKESVDLDGNIFEINSSIAKKIQNVYESLNKKNKKKMVDMMNESEETFNKVISFVIRH